MSAVERFLDVVTAAYRRERDAAPPATREALDDRIRFLTDYRLWGADVAALERLIDGLRSGAYAGRLLTESPAVFGRDLARRWCAFVRDEALAAV
jgi:hypothetical protein